MPTKPILIDALYINMGGGLMILNHLVSNLVAENVDFVLLKDSRCPLLRDESKISETIVLPPSIRKHRKFYVERRNDFRAVVCFGNIPPAIRLNVPVHTYFHNVSLLKIPTGYTTKAKVLSFLKRTHIRSLAKNTDTWIVQTSYTGSLVRKHLAKSSQPILEYPFFIMPDSEAKAHSDQRTDYVFIGDYTSAKGHEYLLEAWQKLKSRGFNGKLHLTVSEEPFKTVVEKAIANGVNIHNHGKIPFSQVLELYRKSKATVYPSLNESLGLGIIEAIRMGCDVIGPDLPYMHCVCRPSVLFSPADADSIVEAVLRYENTPTPRTVLNISDKVKDFIAFISQSRINA